MQLGRDSFYEWGNWPYCMNEETDKWSTSSPNLSLLPLFSSFILPIMLPGWGTLAYVQDNSRLFLVCLTLVDPTCHKFMIHDFYVFIIRCHDDIFSCVFTSSLTFPYIWINVFQTFPAHPQALIVKKCMCFDLRRDSNPRPSCLLTFSKLFLTRTLIFLWVSWEYCWGILRSLGPFELKFSNRRGWDYYKGDRYICIHHIYGKKNSNLFILLSYI